MTIASRPFENLLLTGAAGALGLVLAAPLRQACQKLVLSDLVGALDARGLVEASPCDLADGSAVMGLMTGIDAVVHFGGVSFEGPFEPILQANIRGVHNLYEAARLNGVRRVVFASSNHVTGCYGIEDRVSATQSARPDGNYAVSKLFGEATAQLYFHRYGIETVSLRIGTATAEPPDRRALSSWLSHADLVRLVLAALTAVDVGALVVYGVSANSQRWYDADAEWARIGYQPQDNAEAYRDRIGHILVSPDPKALPNLLQGGSFLGFGPFGMS